MSSDPQRIQAVIDRLKQAYEGSPYKIEADLYEYGDRIHKDTLTLSVIIPARNEFPNIVHTVYSLLHCWEADGFDSRDIEIIIVDNCSENWKDEKYDWKKPGDRGTVTHLMPRGAFYAEVIRVLYDPIAGNHSARNKGASIARGKYLFFSDAHMAYKPGFFKHGLQTVDESGGLVHGGIGWMGAYPPNPSGVGMQYTIKLGEEWKGTWNNYRPWSDDWFYIPAQGHCSVLARRDQFLEYGGYPDVHRTYGGGELYTDMKWWIMGSTVAADPRCIGYHLSSGRGYTWHHDDYIHNVFNCAYALGCDDWLERTYLNYLRKCKKVVLDKFMAEAKVEMQADREWIEKKRFRTFNDCLVERPWDELNIKRKGKALSSQLIFHDTWLDIIKEAPHVQKAYEESKFQAILADFINKHLSEFVYKRQK